jgi:transmembrane sensor
MNHYQHNIETLIAKHFTGEITPEESTWLTDWRNQNPENEAYFGELERLWQLAPLANDSPDWPIRTADALQKVKQQIAFNASQQPQARKISMSFWFRAAAIFIGIAAALFFLRPQSPPGDTYMVSSREFILADTLKDGSVVTLNRNSGLQLASAFNQKERRMHLQGEAFFEVQKDPQRPFIVEASGLEVIVVGTVFNVDESSSPDLVTVSVDEGKVRLQARGAGILLVAGEMGQYNKKTGVISRINRQNGQNPGAYKNKVFEFESTSLQEVIRQLNLAYGANISLKNAELEKCTLTARYNNLPIQRVLQLIAESFSFKTTQTGKQEWVIDGTGCN